MGEFLVIFGNVEFPCAVPRVILAEIRQFPSKCPLEEKNESLRYWTKSPITRREALGTRSQANCEKDEEGKRGDLEEQCLEFGAQCTH